MERGCGGIPKRGGRMKPVTTAAFLGLDGQDDVKSEPRCEVCNWPLYTTTAEGCIPGNCSQRPRPKPATTEPPMVSAKAANILYREKQRYRAALEAIVCLDAFTPMSSVRSIAREALRGEKP